MKNIFALLVSLLILTFGNLANAAEQEIVLAVKKMDCPVCPVTVRKAIEKVTGVLSVEVKFDSKTAIVTFDDEVATPEEIATASTNAGYPATPVEADE